MLMVVLFSPGTADDMQYPFFIKWKYLATDGVVKGRGELPVGAYRARPRVHSALRATMLTDR